MADLIDRQSLLDALHERLCHPKKSTQSAGIAAAIKLVQKQPTLEPIRGEWIESPLSELTGNVWYECSECGAMKKILSVQTSVTDAARICEVKIHERRIK